MSYSRVQYIDTDKTFFTTPAYVTANYEARLDCEILTITAGSDNLIFGVRVNDVYSSYNMVVNVAAARSQWTYYSAGKISDWAGAYTLNHRYNVKINKTTFEYTDLVSETGNTYTFNGSYTVDSSRFLRIGGCWNYSSNSIDNCKAKIRWYGVQFYDDGVLVHNYIPYKDNETGYGVLYDSITHTYLSADNPASVTVGPSVFGPSETELNFSVNGGSESLYLESENPWTATTNGNWITLSANSGSTSATITVTASYNIFSNRTGTILFASGQDEATVSVSQAGNTLIPIMKIFRNGNRIN